MRISWWSGAATFVFAALFMAACDATPGVDASDGAPPRLSDVSFDPDTVILPGGDEPTTVTLNVSVAASDADGDLAEVAYVVRAPQGGLEPVASGPLARGAGGRYAASVEVAVEPGAVGTYTLLVYAVDEGGRLSDQLRALIPFVQPEGSPPVITAVEADPAVVRPPTTLRLIATVEDPDGLGNILRVEGRTPAGDPFQLFDDGQSLGDETAGDGRYTARFDVPAGVTPGVQTFTLQAFDRSGLASEIVELDVTIE